MAIKLGLDNIKYLCAKLNNPEDDLKFIHIAGTNGKGSTGAFISSILKEAGFRVGSYSSPAVFNEREIIKVNNRPISKKDWEAGFKIIDDAVCELEAEGYDIPSPFEKETALAYWYFKKEKCDIVCLECGMGGAEDATNIIKNALACVFTPISIDHTNYLGNTLEKIATVKAGIIKPSSVVVSTIQDESVRAVLENRSHNRVVFADIETELEKYIPLMGDHQIQNATLAKYVVLNLPSPFNDIDEKTIIKGIRNVKWPGRFEKINEKPVIILDGAHNEGAAKALRNAVIKKYPNKNIIEVFGMLYDKDHVTVASIMAPVAKHILTVSTKGQRAYSAENLARDVSIFNTNVSAIGGIEEALDIAKLMATTKDIILVFGSLSFHREVVDWVNKKE